VAAVNLPDLEVEAEAREAAARVATRREIGRAESYEHWKKIAAALNIGRQFALRTIDPEAPWHQRRYGYAFHNWAQQHGFGSMPKQARSWALALHENAAAIEQWHQGLSERERKRKRLINPQSVVKRWQRETQTALANGKCPTDLKRDAKAAWKRFKWCLRSLPASEAAPLWQAALAEAAAMARAAPMPPSKLLLKIHSQQILGG